MEQSELILEPLLSQALIRRRSLLPTWIKVFVWIFMLAGAVTPFALLAGLMGTHFQIAMYGLKSYSPLDLIGLLLSFFFLIKGMVAYGLWFEKPWAVKLAIVDAAIGIMVCCFVMLIQPFLSSNGFSINIRLELLLLIPYLIKLQAIKHEWRNGAASL